MSAWPEVARPLPGDLLLRTARPTDLAQIQELLVARGEEADAVDLELMVTDPDAGWELCAVVLDGDRVISTASLMDERVTLSGVTGPAGVTVPAGQVELVATAVEYERRGLVRALMGWAHELSAGRGHLLQVMIGIPYFYRLFGYEYAIDIPPARELEPPQARQPLASHVFRPAAVADLRGLEALQQSAQRSFQVTMPHSPARRRWLLAHESSTTVVLERAGAIVATGRVQADDDGILLAEAAAADGPAANALLDHVIAERPAVPVTVVDRPGTVTDEAWGHRLAPAGPDAAQYYLRIADPASLLSAVRPVLFDRLRAFGDSRVSGAEVPAELLLSTFGRHYRMEIRADALGDVRTGGVMQAPYLAGGAGVAPDQLGALLFGGLGMAGLTGRRPDVYPGPHRELYEALFPPLAADLLTFYLPY